MDSPYASLSQALVCILLDPDTAAEQLWFGFAELMQLKHIKKRIVHSAGVHAAKLILPCDTSSLVRNLITN